MKQIIALIVLFVFSQTLMAQTKDVELGSKYKTSLDRQGGFYDYSDEGSVNMRVAVWGFVRYPGRYLVPITTTVSDLFSYAGGPLDDSELRDLRLYRIMEDSTQHMFTFDFDDLLWSENIKSETRTVPKLQGGDLLIVPGAPRLYFKDWFRVGLSIFSAMVSLALLIIRISK